MKNVLITGASSGIGEAIATLAAEKQWHAILGYGSGKDRTQVIVDEIVRRGGQATSIQLRLQEPKSLERAFGELTGKIQGLDALVLCASAPLDLLSFTTLTPDIFLEQLNVNAVSSQVLIAQAWKLFFRAKQDGHVVGVLSQAMESPLTPSTTAYVAAKRALASVLESATLELGRSGLRVSAVSPDYTDTPMLMRLHPHLVEAMRTKALGGRFLTPREVAEQIMTQLDSPPAPGIFSIDPIRLKEVHR